jgi:hypothetical protein
MVQRVPDDDLDFGPDQVMIYEGTPFTGTAIDDDETTHSEMEYMHGLRHGVTREWRSSGFLKTEMSHREGMLHGTVREYDEGGRIIESSLFECGTLIRRSVYGEDGDEVEVYHIDPGSGSYEILETYRQRLGWPSPE